MRRQQTYTLAPGLLDIASDAASIPGLTAALGHSPGTEPARLTLRYAIDPHLPPLPADATRIGAVTGIAGAGVVQYATPAIGPLRPWLRLAQLDQTPELVANRAYHRVVRFPAGRVLPPGRHLLDIAAVRLLLDDFVLTHAAAITAGDGGVLIAGAGGSGKSLLALMAADRGFGYLSEDLAILDAERVHGVPFTASFAADLPGGQLRRAGRGASAGAALARAVTRLAPPLGALLPAPTTDIRRLAPQARIERSAPLRVVVLLGAGPRRVTELAPDEAAERLLLLGRGEIGYAHNPLLLGYAYLNAGPSPDDLARREREILQRALGGAACYQCQAQEPAELFDLIARVAGPA